jgi:mannose-6-phosphate isomerase
MIEKDELYPLLFEPIYMNVMWGGDMLKGHFGRQVPDSDLPVGESWEISDRDDAISVITNGSLKGKNLRSLIEYYEKSLLGDKFGGGRFPLLVKLIDAGKRLSLQVHPDESACLRLEGAEPKTEMWYVVAAKPGAKIFAGLRPNCTQRQFVSTMHSSEIENSLQSFSSRPGDSYFINAGRVHAIGGGNLLLEIQQNSNTTYRISDWGRVGADGKFRQLHPQEALDSINFTDRISPRIPSVSGNSDYNRKFPLINRCPFFKVDELRIVDPWIDSTDKNSFHLISAINSSIKVACDSRYAELEPGRTCLIPACFGKYHISTASQDRETIVLKTTL